jgi:multidrug efflux pump subunit AcrA (membrane-fusion protein)
LALPYVATLAVAACVATLATAYVSRRPPAVEADEIWRGTVTRGSMIRQVSASGTLVAPELRSATNQVEGVVERVLVLPGQTVRSDTVLVELGASDIRRARDVAQSDLAGAESEYQLAVIDAENHRQDLAADLASAEADYSAAVLDLQAKARIPDVVSRLDIEIAKLRSAQLQKRLAARQAQNASFAKYLIAQQGAGKARVTRAHQQVAQLDQQIAALHVQAGIAGVVQEIDVHDGQRLPLGQVVAQIVNPNNLIARVQVSEQDAQYVLPGQRVDLSIASEAANGVVTRIDPTARDQQVSVDVAFDHQHDRSLRPELSVTARITLERIPDTLLVDRPVGLSGGNQAFALYRIDSGNRSATRVNVVVGRVSAKQIEILHGLRAGDAVILNELPQIAHTQTIRLQ